MFFHAGCKGGVPSAINSWSEKVGCHSDRPDLFTAFAAIAGMTAGYRSSRREPGLCLIWIATRTSAMAKKPAAVPNDLKPWSEAKKRQGRERAVIDNCEQVG
jgi:hypothetical protein